MHSSVVQTEVLSITMLARQVHEENPEQVPLFGLDRQPDIEAGANGANSSAGEGGNPGTNHGGGYPQSREDEGYGSRDQWCQARVFACRHDPASQVGCFQSGVLSEPRKKHDYGAIEKELN
ncbi:hypothetical protein PG987_000280 [Apiospora arundinis]